MKKFDVVWCCAVAIIIISMTSFTSQQCFSANDILDGRVNNVFNTSTDFAFQLFKSITKTTPGPFDNIFFSPISIWSVLMVAYLGAKGDTELELAKALGISKLNKGAVATAFLKEQQMYNNKNTKYTLRIVNKLLFDKYVSIRECIQKALRTVVEQARFYEFAEVDRLAINKWIEDQTNNKIKDLLPSGSVDANTVMIIINAAYFKGIWELPFNTLITRPGDFFVQPDQSIKANMMYQQDTFPFASDIHLNCIAVELPYVGHEIAMVILLPNPDSSVENLILQLSRRSVKKLFKHMKPKLVSLTIPKLKTEQSFNLVHNLSKLGITGLFNPFKADFSGFTDQAAAFVQSIQHKAFVEVDETGTEAAAGTSLLMTHSYHNSKYFMANRPFVILIRNKVANTILFTGLIRNPKQ